MGKKLLCLFPFLVIVILSVVGILLDEWFFLAFNIIGIGFSALFCAATESISPKVGAVIATLLFILTGVMILSMSIAAGDSMKVTGTVIDTKWSGMDDDGDDEYDVLVKYEVDGKTYQNTVISYHEPKPGEPYTLSVRRNDPGKPAGFSQVGGIVVGSLYLVVSAAIVFFGIRSAVRKWLHKRKNISVLS